MGAWGVMTEGFSTRVPGHLKTISLRDKKIKSLGSGAPAGNLDGVEADGHDAYFVTDWMAGKLYRIHPGGEADLLLPLGQGLHQG
jgi:sugar lactone lactonase YvrE